MEVGPIDMVRMEVYIELTHMRINFRGCLKGYEELYIHSIHVFY